MAKLPTRTGRRPRRPTLGTTPAERRRLTGVTEQGDDPNKSTRKGRPKQAPLTEEERANIPTVSDDDKAIVEQGLKKFAVIVSAESEQRARELEDLLFDRALPQDQWPQNIWDDRQGSSGPYGQVDARPCLVIPKLDQPVQQVLNEIAASNLGIRVTAKTGAGKRDAEIRQGLIRCIEQDSLASTAYNWGAGRMVKCGRGFWRVNKRFANDGDFEQDLTIDRLLDQGSAYCDPFATEATWADMDHAFVTHDYPEDVYLSKFGSTALHNAIANDTGVLTSILNAAPSWVSTVAGVRVFRVAEYFQAIYTDDVLLKRVNEAGEVHHAFLSEFEGEVKEAVKQLIAEKKLQTREVKRRTIRWVVMDAYAVLDRETWEGRYIPIVPCIGKEYYIEGKRCFKGLISNSKDAQRSYNYMRSAQVEAVGLAPRAPWVMAEGQDEGYEQMWEQANVRNFPYLVYKPVSLDGELAPPPQRNVAEPAIQAMTMAVREADADIKATTGRWEASLGQRSGADSGKAISALQQQGENSTNNFVDSQALAITYTGMILNDMLEHVYNTPGRLARILGEEGKERTVLLNKPFVYDEQQEPQPVAEDDPEAEDAEHYDLSKGQFLVRVSTGKSYPTQQEEAFRVLQSIFQAAPQLVPIAADLWVEQLDTPVATQIAERLRRANPQLQDDNDPAQKKIPPKVKAQMDQLQQQLQTLQQQHEQLTQALEGATEKLKGKQLEAEAKAKQDAITENKKIQAELKMKAAELMSADAKNLLDNRVKLVTEMAKLQVGRERDAMLAEVEKLQAELDRRHEYVMSLTQGQLDERLDARARGHETAMRALDHLAASPEEEEGGVAPAAPPAGGVAPPAAPPAPPPAPVAPGFEAPPDVGA